MTMKPPPGCTRTGTTLARCSESATLLPTSDSVIAWTGGLPATDGGTFGPSSTFWKITDVSVVPLPATVNLGGGPPLKPTVMRAPPPGNAATPTFVSVSAAWAAAVVTPTRNGTSIARRAAAERVRIAVVYPTEAPIASRRDKKRVAVG